MNNISHRAENQSMNPNFSVCVCEWMRSVTEFTNKLNF
jgi:hypothetical protein